jgi:hypothetical protein
MDTALHFNTTVLPGHRIEITAPELAEGTSVELIVNDTSAVSIRRYPSRLEAEYQALIDRQLHGGLNPAEAIRLQDICHVIEEIDRLTLSGDRRTVRLNQIEQEVAQIRATIEALPDL